MKSHTADMSPQACPYRIITHLDLLHCKVCTVSLNFKNKSSVNIVKCKKN